MTILMVAFLIVVVSYIVSHYRNKSAWYRGFKYAEREIKTHGQERIKTLRDYADLEREVFTIRGNKVGVNVDYNDFDKGIKDYIHYYYTRIKDEGPKKVCYKGQLMLKSCLKDNYHDFCNLGKI